MFKKILIVLSLAALAACSSNHEGHHASTEYYNSLDGKVHIRSGAGMSHKAIGIAEAGAAGYVTECTDNKKWCNIDFKDGVDGWVYMEYFTARETHECGPQCNHGEQYKYSQRHVH